MSKPLRPFDLASPVDRPDPERFSRRQAFLDWRGRRWAGIRKGLGS